MEDSDTELERLVQQFVRTIEQMSGESIENYLK